MRRWQKLWNDPGPDTGWSWIVACSCCWITTGMYGIVRSSGFLYVAVIETFGVARKDAALPFAVMLSFSNFIGLCGSILLQFSSMRQIVIGGCFMGCGGVAMCYFATSVHWITFFIGVLTGSGIGLSTSFLTVLLSQYFVNARTTANGIWLAGRSISGFLFPPLIVFLLTTFGLRGTFLVLGGVLSNTLIGAGFLRPRTPTHFPLILASATTNGKSKALVPNDKPKEGILQLENIKNENKEADQTEVALVIKQSPKQVQRNSLFHRCSEYLKTCLRLARNPVYILNIFTDTYHAFTITATGMTMVDYTLDSGHSMNVALMVLLSLNISDLVARIFTGFISDRGYLSRPTLIAFTLTISGLALFIVTLVGSVYVVMFLCTLYGTMMGCAIINIVAYYTEYMTQTELPIGIGVGNFIKGFIFLLQSVLVGFFRDQVGSYVYLYYLFAFIAPVLSFFWVIVLLVHKFKHRKMEEAITRTSIS